MSVHNQAEIKKRHLWNMGNIGFIQTQNSCKVVVFKGSSNVLSNFSDADFHMNFVVYVSFAKYVTPPLIIIPVKRFNSTLSKVVILRVIKLQQHQKVLSIILYY